MNLNLLDAWYRIRYRRLAGDVDEDPRWLDSLKVDEHPPADMGDERAVEATKREKGER